MSLAQVVESVYWPFTGVGLLLVFVPWMKYVEQPWRRLIFGVGMLASVPTLLWIFFLFYQSVGLLLAQDFITVALGVLVIRWVIQTKSAALWHRAASGALGLVFIALGSWYIVGDYLLPRREIVASVDRIVADHVIGRRYQAYIGRARYSIAADLLQSTRVGQRVKLEVGVGTRSVFRNADVSAHSELPNQ